MSDFGWRSKLANLIGFLEDCLVPRRFRMWLRPDGTRRPARGLKWNGQRNFRRPAERRLAARPFNRLLARQARGIGTDRTTCTCTAVHTTACRRARRTTWHRAPCAIKQGSYGPPEHQGGDATIGLLVDSRTTPSRAGFKSCVYCCPRPPVPLHHRQKPYEKARR